MRSTRRAGDADVLVPILATGYRSVASSLSRRSPPAGGCALVFHARSWPEQRLPEPRPVEIAVSVNQPPVEDMPRSPQPEDVPIQPSATQVQNKPARPGLFGKIKSFTASLFR
jgi:hypothetical protein